MEHGLIKQLWDLSNLPDGDEPSFVSLFPLKTLEAEGKTTCHEDKKALDHCGQSKNIKSSIELVKMKYVNDETDPQSTKI